jgi:hypothetical protein
LRRQGEGIGIGIILDPLDKALSRRQAISDGLACPFGIGPRHERMDNSPTLALGGGGVAYDASVDVTGYPVIRNDRKLFCSMEVRKFY